MLQKLHFIMLLTMVLPSMGIAQVTIDQSAFPSVGDTLFTARDNLPSVSVGSVGGDQVWDYTSLQAPFASQTILLDANEGSAAELFPTADLVTEVIGGGEAYYAAETDAYLLLGYSGFDPTGLGLDLLTHIEPPIVERHAPLIYEDTHSSAYNIAVPFSADMLPPQILESLPITPDSLRVRISTDRNDMVDAWGTMHIPGGTFDVLREKRVEYQNTALDIKIGDIFPWQDITDLVGDIPGFEGLFGLDTLVSYHFFSPTAKEPIAVVRVAAEAQTEASTVTFKSIDIPTTTLDVSHTAEADVFAYPNPAIDSARFAFSNLKSGNYTLKIYNILGLVVWQNTYRVVGSKTVAVDLSELHKGTYLYSLQDETSKTIKTKRLLIIRP